MADSHTNVDTVEVDPVDVKQRDVDQQGRVSVGTDYAGETVRVAVVDVVDDDPDPLARRLTDLEVHPRIREAIVTLDEEGHRVDGERVVHVAEDETGIYAMITAIDRYSLQRFTDRVSDLTDGLLEVEDTMPEHGYARVRPAGDVEDGDQA